MSQKKTVLIIDDEPKTIIYFSTLLEDHGFIAYSADSADEGLRQLQAHRPDLILLDLLMPLMTGIVLFHKIKKDSRYQDIPIIIVTGIKDYFTEDHREFFEKLRLHKPNAYLEKPVDPNHLIRTVSQTLELNT